jgi:hypothetical protein
MKTIFAVLLLAFPLLLISGDLAWQSPASGLWLGVFKTAIGSGPTPAIFHIIKIDPERYQLQFLSEKENGPRKRTLKQWCTDFKLTAAINAGMYDTDFLTHTGYARNFHKIHNPRFNTRYGAFLVFNPVKPVLPAVQIVEKQEPDWKTRLEQYQTVIQNYRLIGHPGQLVWTNPGPENSTAAIALDQSGKVLFAFTATPISPKDFGEQLLALPLNIKSALYLEGGSQAGLYAAVGKIEWNLWGVDAFFPAPADSSRTGPLPNIIGIMKR